MIYNFREPAPYRHQKDAVRFALRRFREGRHVALFMEMRTGKTRTSIDVAGALHLRNGLRKVVVVAPARVLGVWASEIPRFFPYTSHVHVWDAAARKHPIPEVPGVDVAFLLVNIDAFATPGKKLPSGRRSKATGRFRYRALIEKWLGGTTSMCILDESHKIKNASGKAANMLVSMREMFTYRMILTGTPVTKANRIHDIYMQWKFLNPDVLTTRAWASTSEDFRQHTGKWAQNTGFPIWRGPREEGIADVKRMITPDSVIVRREDCFDLPPREVRILPVALSQATRAHYDEMAASMVTQIKEGVIAEAAIPLVVTLRLLQMTSGFVSVDKVPHTIGCEKREALTDYLANEIIEKDEKVVIAARFQYDLDTIAEVCNDLSLDWWAVRGGMKRVDTDRAIDTFKRAETGAMIVQPQAASLGIDLSSASNMVWYSLTYAYTDFVQCCDRIALSRASTTFNYLLATGTVDELVYEVLQSDGEVARAIMENPERIMLR